MQRRESRRLLLEVTRHRELGDNCPLVQQYSMQRTISKALGSEESDVMSKAKPSIELIPPAFISSLVPSATIHLFIFIYTTNTLQLSF